MLTTRLLPFAEWGRLAETDAAFLVGAPARAAEDARVVVVEEDGAIVAVTVVMRCWHADGIWIAPSRRGRASVVWRLLGALRALAADLGVGGYLVAVTADVVDRIVRTLGATPLPGRHYTVPMTRRK